MEASGGRSGRRRSEQSAPKPKKLGKGAQDFLAEAAKAEAEKVAEERRRRQMEDMKLVQNKDLHAAEDSDESEEEDPKAGSKIWSSLKSIAGNCRTIFNRPFGGSFLGWVPGFLKFLNSVHETFI